MGDKDSNVSVGTNANAEVSAEKLLKRSGKALKEAAELLAALAKSREEPSAWPERVAAGKRLEAISAKLDLAAVQQTIEGSLAALKDGNADAYDRYRRRFGHDLSEALAPLGFELSGQYPEFRAGVFSIVVDAARGRATIQVGPDTVARERPSPARIAAALAGFKKDVLNCSLDEDDFLARVLEAWQRARRLSAGSATARQPILAVLEELNWVSQARSFRLDPSSAGFKAVTRLGFAWDLYRLRRARRLSLGGRRLVLHAAVYDETRKRESYLWVPDDEQGNGTRFSGVSFREEI